MYNIYLLTVQSTSVLQADWALKEQLQQSCTEHSTVASPHYSYFNQANQKAINFFFKLTTQDSVKNLINKPMVVHTFNSSAQEAQAEVRFRGQPGLENKFQDSKGYTEKACLEKPKRIT